MYAKQIQQAVLSSTYQTPVHDWFWRLENALNIWDARRRTEGESDLQMEILFTQLTFGYAKVLSSVAAPAPDLANAQKCIDSGIWAAREGVRANMNVMVDHWVARLKTITDDNSFSYLDPHQINFAELEAIALDALHGADVIAQDIQI